MNWTEGNLARHSNGRGGSKHAELVRRQKEHFAKVRSKISGKSSTSSPHFINQSGSPSSDRPRGSPRGLPSRKAPSNIVIRKHVSSSAGSFMGDRSHPFLKQQSNFPKETGQSSKFFQLQDEKALAQKRRQLLEKSDWVGTSLQKPVLAAQSCSQSLLRHSKWQAPDVTLHPPRDRTRRHLNSRKDNISGHDRCGLNQSHVLAPRLLRPEDVNITIGSQLGTTSYGISSSSSGKPPSDLSANYCQIYSVRSRLNARHGQSTWDNAADSSSLHGCSGNSIQLPGSDNWTHPEETSPLQILQPVPLHFKQPSVLCSGSQESDLASTTMGQIGYRRLAVSPSHLDENEAWRRWIALGQSDEPDNSEEESKRPHNTVDISPGMSERPLITVFPQRDDITRQAPQQISFDVAALPQLPSPDLSVPTARAIPPRKETKPCQPPRQDPSGGTTGGLTQLLNSGHAPYPVANGTEKLKPEVVFEVENDPSLSIPDAAPQPPNSTQNRETEPSNRGGGLEAIPSPPVPTALSLEPSTNEAWMKFIFADDSDDLEEAVFEEAKHEAACSVHRNDGPEDRSEIGSLVETAATWGSHLLSEGEERRVSHEAVVGSSSTSCTSDLLEAAEFRPPHASMVSFQAPRRDAQTELSKSNVTDPDFLEKRNISDAHLCQGSTEDGDEFRFVAPKPFIGKLASLHASVSCEQVLPPQRMYRGKRNRATYDGRADIRGVPDCKDDPIEEFSSENGVDLIQIPESSLFGHLEML